MSYVGKVTAGGSTHLVGSTLFGTCTSATGAQTNVVTCGDFDKLETGVTIHVAFQNSTTLNSGGSMLNVNSTGSKVIYVPGGSNADVSAMSVLAFTYDGEYWVLNGAIDKDTITTYSTITASELTTGTSTGKRVVTPKVIHDYVTSQMSDVAGALVYKGTVSAGSELLNTALKKGWYYIVDTAGTYGTATCEPGDMIIVNTAGTYTTASALAAAVNVIQTNIDTISNSDIDTIVAS